MDRRIVWMTCFTETPLVDQQGLLPSSRRTKSVTGSANVSFLSYSTIPVSRLEQRRWWRTDGVPRGTRARTFHGQ
jgi:hypothetical protein